MKTKIVCFAGWLSSHLLATGLAQPVITNQPYSQAVVPGGNVTFTIGASGTEPLSYQWQKNSGAGFWELAGRRDVALALTNAQPWDAADYRVVVTNVGGARTSAVARLYVTRFSPISSTIFADDFNDQTTSAWGLLLNAGSGGLKETNGQFCTYGSWRAVPTINPWDTLVEGGNFLNWSISEGQTIEFRAELVAFSQDATNSPMIEIAQDYSHTYILQKGGDWIRIAKYSPSGSTSFLYERAAIKNTNVVLSLALTKATPNVILTARVLDRDDPDTVLYQHSVVDTPGVDPSLSHEEFAALSGMSFVMVPDVAGAPYASGIGVLIGLWQYTDGQQPPAQATFDRFEIRKYEPVMTRYVDASSATPAAPHTNWVTAARVIQDAVDAALPGDEVVVTNGVYASGGRAVGTNLLVNRVAMDKPVTLRSVNGPQFTVIEGYQLPDTTNGDGAVRCVYLADGGRLSGFTLSKGATRRQSDWPARLVESSGGGLWCESQAAVVFNCVVTGNSAWSGGGGARGGTLYGCTVAGNQAGWEGGGTVSSQIYNSTLSGNVSDFDGGGVAGGTLYNCSLAHNSAGRVGGGAVLATLQNCTLTGNAAQGGGGASSGWLYNCTLTGNSATRDGGGVNAFYEYGYCDCELYNCIVYFNHAPQEPNYAVESYASNYIKLTYSCTTPLPINGVGNITNAPLFNDYAGDTLRLQSNSPCINAGNNAFVGPGNDIDGNPRIVSGTVDIGAYEYQGAGSTISYAWLQQYGLPTDGSVDDLDIDIDGQNNWQEWRCQTCPTNALSALRLVSAKPASTNVVVTWESVAGVNYYLEKGTNLASPFIPAATGILGQSGTTGYTDTNAAAVAPLFYRVGVAY